MKLHGKIVAGDLTEKTIIIECPDGISGIVLGTEVVIRDDYSLIYPYANKLTERKSIENKPNLLDDEFKHTYY